METLTHKPSMSEDRRKPQAVVLYMGEEKQARRNTGEGRRESKTGEERGHETAYKRQVVLKIDTV